MKHNLLAEMARHGISQKDIYEALGIGQRTLYDKIYGRTDFTWNEVLTIHDKFFPDLDIQYLFASGDEGR